MRQWRRQSSRRMGLEAEEEEEVQEQEAERQRRQRWQEAEEAEDSECHAAVWLHSSCSLFPCPVCASSHTSPASGGDAIAVALVR